MYVGQGGRGGAKFVQKFPKGKNWEIGNFFNSFEADQLTMSEYTSFPNLVLKY